MEKKNLTKKSRKGKRNGTRSDAPKFERVSDDAKLKNESPVGNPNWYFTDHELAEEASRFSFQSFIGSGVLSGSARLPSIMMFALNPSLGGYVSGADSTAAVNLMARKLYAQLSNKSGRTASYAPQDVMTLILAMGEVVSYASYLRRAFGLMFTYNQRNRDLPKALINAMGVDADDLFANAAPYRVRYNTALNMANKIPIPANLTWFQKCEAIYQGVYADAPDALAQLYAFIPATTWKINESAYEGGTILETIPAAYNKTGGLNRRTMSSHISTLQGMIDALLTSSTYNVIYGDILNYAQNQNVPLLHMGIVDELYSVVPTYDEEVLLHVHNMFIGSSPTIGTYEFEDTEAVLRTPFNDVYPDPNNNNLMYMPLFSMANSTELEPGECPVFNDINIVDYPYGNPDLTQRIEATRFSARIAPESLAVTGVGGLNYRFSTVADHYCVGCMMYANGQALGVPAYFESIVLASMMNAAIISGREKFRYCPLQYQLDNGYTELRNVYGEINYFTNLDADWLSRLNSLCFQGLFELR